METKLDLARVRELSERVRELSGYELEPWKPLVGENLFRRESGAVASQFHDPPAIEPYSSELVGAERSIVLGKKSGIDSIRIKAEELGLDLDEDRQRELLERGEEARRREARARYRRRVPRARAESEQEVSRMTVHELRVALTADDYDRALAFYRDGLGLPLRETWEEEGARGALFDAGRATLEVLSVEHAAMVDRIEVGEPVGARVRLALEVDDSVKAADRLVAAGAELVGGPVVTPWAHRNVRLRDPDGMQLTLFTVLDPADAT